MMRLFGMLLLHLLFLSCSYLRSGNMDVLVFSDGRPVPNANVQILGYQKEAELKPIELGKYQTNGRGEAAAQIDFSLFSRFKIVVTDDSLDVLRQPAIRYMAAPKWYADPDLKAEIRLTTIPTIPARAAVVAPTTSDPEDLLKVVLVEPELTAELQTNLVWRKARREFTSRLMSETRFQGKKDSLKKTAFDYQIQLKLSQDKKGVLFQTQLFDNKGVLMFESTEPLKEQGAEQTASKVYDQVAEKLPLDCNLLRSSVESAQ